MKTSTTFKGASKPYGATGHFDEPMRHKLQGMGIKTGNLAEFSGSPTGKFGTPSGLLIHNVPSRISPQYSSWTDKSFKINDHIEIMAGYRKMRDGFNHYAVLYVDGVPVDEAKAHYINRTWESYDYQSVMQSLVNKTRDLSPEQKAEAKAYLEKGHADMSDFKMTAMIAKLGDVMTSSKKESNDWKERMIKAGLGDRGLEMPEDWDTLSEETKEARLNAVIKEMGEAGKHEEAEEHRPLESSQGGHAETTYNLEPRYDARSSFYGKAKVRSGAGRQTLESYGTDVAYVEDGKAHVNGTYSQTTLRHIKEFLKANGFKAETKEQIEKDYETK